MQQTEKRGFNIIETSDAFSPEALNDNTRKIEAALDAHEAAVAEQVDDLDARLQVFEAKKLVIGTYIGNGDNGRDHSQTIHLGFTPELLVIQYALTAGANMMLRNGDTGFMPYGQIVEDGFWVSSKVGPFNTKTVPYNYLALA